MIRFIKFINVNVIIIVVNKINIGTIISVGDYKAVWMAQDESNNTIYAVERPWNEFEKYRFCVTTIDSEGRGTIVIAEKFKLTTLPKQLLLEYILSGIESKIIGDENGTRLEQGNETKPLTRLL